MTADAFKLPSLEGLPKPPWRVYEQPIADKEEAKRELCRMVDGTPDFQPVIAYVTDDDWDLAICLNAGGKTATKTAPLIAAIPDMVREIERLQRDLAEYKSKLALLINAHNGANIEIKRLRAEIERLELSSPALSPPSPSGVNRMATPAQIEAILRQELRLSFHPRINDSDVIGDLDYPVMMIEQYSITRAANKIMELINANPGTD